MHLQYAPEKQVLNKFQIPQFTRRTQVVQWADHPFPVGGSRFESTGTLTNLRIVHYEFIAPSVTSVQQAQPLYKQTNTQTSTKNVSMTHVLSGLLHHSTEVSLAN